MNDLSIFKGYRKFSVGTQERDIAINDIRAHSCEPTGLGQRSVTFWTHF